jgi:hypothetical protein
MSYDLIISFVIFIIGILLFYKFSIDLSNIQEEKFNSIFSDAKTISSMLVSAGYPTNWTTNNVSLIGITNNNKRINETKLSNFSNLNYNTTRALFGTKYHYYVFFKDKNGNLTTISNINGVGKPGVNSSNLIEKEDPLNIVSISRYLIYNSSIIRMRLQVWEKG